MDRVVDFRLWYLGFEHSFVCRRLASFGDPWQCSLYGTREKVRNIFLAFLRKFFTSAKQHLIPAFFHFEKRKNRVEFWHFFCGDAMPGMARWLFVFVNNLQKAESSRFALWWPFFWDWSCEKAASQSLNYGIFTKTSGHLRTFFGAYAEGEKLKGTLILGQ